MRTCVVLNERMSALRGPGFYTVHSNGTVGVKLSTSFIYSSRGWKKNDMGCSEWPKFNYRRVFEVGRD